MHSALMSLVQLSNISREAGVFVFVCLFFCTGLFYFVSNWSSLLSCFVPVPLHAFSSGSESLEAPRSCTTTQNALQPLNMQKRQLCTYTMFCSHLLALFTGDFSQVDQIHLVCHQHHRKGLPARETGTSHEPHSSRT